MRKYNAANSVEVWRLPVERPRPFLWSAPPSVISDVAEYMQDSFDALLAADHGLANWVQQVRRLELQLVVFGGWARDRIFEDLYSRKTPSRDIDFVVHGDVSVVKVLPRDAILNPFGGFGFQSSKLHVDAWNLKDTFLIRRNGLPVSFGGLPSTADYTVNAVAFKPIQFFSQPEVIDCGAVNAISNRILEFAADEVAQPRVQAARAVILAVRLKLEPSPTVVAFVRAVCKNPNDLSIVRSGILNYCPQQFLQDAASLLDYIMDEGSRLV